MSQGTFDRHRVEAAFAPRRAQGRGAIGCRIEYLDSIGSTNDLARELASAGEPEGTVVIAGEQTQGRGRGDRPWHSPPGLGLYLSVLLRPGGPPSGIPAFGLLAAVAAGSAIGAMTPLGAAIKWPNDVLIIEPPPRRGRRKVCGLLAEARSGSEGTRDVVIGIGVNVNHVAADFPPEIAALATSLRIARGRPLALEDAAIRILEEIDAWYTLWRREGMPPVLEAYRALAVDLEGRRVRVTGAGPLWTGTTAGLADDGALRVVPDEAQGVVAPAVPVRYGDVLRLEDA